MSRYVDLSEKVTVTFYDQECEEWTMRTVTIEDVLDGVCDDYTVLPSAQPERIRGRWIEDGYTNGKAVCDQCGEPCATYVWNYPRDRFCKWCGADMRGEQDE